MTWSFIKNMQQCLSYIVANAAWQSPRKQEYGDVINSPRQSGISKSHTWLAWWRATSKCKQRTHDCANRLRSCDYDHASDVTQQDVAAQTSCRKHPLWEARDLRCNQDNASDVITQDVGALSTPQTFTTGARDRAVSLDWVTPKIKITGVPRTNISMHFPHDLQKCIAKRQTGDLKKTECAAPSNQKIGNKHIWNPKEKI